MEWWFTTSCFRVVLAHDFSSGCLFKVEGSSVNPCDYIEFGIGCNGGAGTLGMDLSGTIVSLPSVAGTCSHLAVGDEVWADIGGVKGDTGAMAEYAVVNCGQTGLKPKSLNFTAAGKT